MHSPRTRLAEEPGHRSRCSPVGIHRPYLHYDVSVKEQRLGTFDTALGKEFFRAVCQHGGLTLHIDVLHGENGHHILEAVFKGFGRALKSAVTAIQITGSLSSKGCL